MRESSLSESTLLAQARAGDGAATHLLLLQHHDQLLAELRRHVPKRYQSVIAAEDVCQEAYVAAVRNLADFDSAAGGGFQGWLRVIARRKLTDAIRAQRTAKRGGGQRVAGAPASQTESTIAILQLVNVDERTPSRSAARREAASLVRECLNRLAADYRQVLQLRYIQGLNVPDTAVQMGRPEGAIRMLCTRALQQLAQEIGDPARVLSRSR